MIGVSCGVSLLSSTGHLPTLALPLSLLGADRGLWLAAARCRHWGYMGVATRVGGAPRPCVVVGGTWEHSSHYPAAALVVVHGVTHWRRGHSTTPLSWLGLHVACNSHWRSASWQRHCHGHHWGRSHRRRGLGHTQLTAWVGSPSDGVMAGITCRVPLSGGGQWGHHCQGRAWPT